MSYLYKIYNKDLEEKYSSFIKFYIDHDLKYQIKDILPDHFLDQYNIDEELVLEEVLKLDKDFGYIDLYNKHNFLFDSLQGAKIDGLALLAFKEIENNKTILSTLNSFNPRNGYASKVEYNRSSTLTGRLTVKRGPKILTLPSKCKSIIKSRYKKGKILSLDFKSLEPRLAKLLCGSVKTLDIYEEILENLSFVVDRSVIKKAVISTLYGYKQKYLDNLSESRSSEVFKVVNDYFDISSLIALGKNLDKHEIRRNYFGRPIWNLEETKENVLANNYIQSSAVDLVLTYFCNLVKDFQSKNLVPLFIIHDALILDVDFDILEEFKEYVQKGYTHNCLGTFPLDITYITKD